MLATIAFFLVFLAVMLFVYGGVPFIVTTMVEVNKKRAKDFARDMDRTMVQEDIRKVSVIYIVGPFVFAAVGFALYQFVGMLAGGVLGFVIPKMYANALIQQRKAQFDNQLVDALMIMSSSFRGGLSLIQSMEAVVEEMPEPIRQEFGIVLGENKMGVSLDEAMGRLYKRMASPALQQMVSAILLARETGGNLPLIFSRIVSTIRERKKIEESLRVLTLQGKLQAFVMSGLPVAFFLMVNSTNPNYFRLMTTTDTGRLMIFACVVLWVIGTLIIIKISSFKDV
jgi:tight adherence protein B